VNYPLAVVLSVALISLATVACKLLEEYFNWKRSWVDTEDRELKKEIERL
jgi:hypothetical protein